MGSPEGVGQNDEQPQYTVNLHAYWIDRTEVTNAMFTVFVINSNYQTDAEKTGKSWVVTGSHWEAVSGADWWHPLGPSSNLSGLEDHPVVHVSWNDAQSYCEWAGRSLPTEAEWEKAARGTEGWMYPWGDQSPNSDLANYNWNIGGTTKVGSYPNGSSQYGAVDMAGNVWEWVEDWYDSGAYGYYSSINIVDNPAGPTSGQFKVVRGGSWDKDLDFLRLARRGGYNPSRTALNIGFRCALSQK